MKRRAASSLSGHPKYIDERSSDESEGDTIDAYTPRKFNRTLSFQRAVEEDDKDIAADEGIDHLTDATSQSSAGSSSVLLPERPMGAARERRSVFCFGASATPPCLARELNQMPMAGREHVNHDIFGISMDSNAEWEEHMQEKLYQLDQQIQQIPNNEKKAYNRAMELNADYVLDDALRIAFLRSVEGSPKRAAKRLVRHYQTKLELFGEACLCKPIELSDLSEDDMEALESGGFQVLKDTDRAGRPILFGRYTVMKYKNIMNMVRALWYCWCSMVESEEAQRLGVIAIGYEVGKIPLERPQEPDDSIGLDFDDTDLSFLNGGFMPTATPSSEGGFDKELAREILKIPLSVPIRPVGYHICADSTQWQGITDMVMVTICKFVRLRMKFHHGTQQECNYALMTHGIPVNALPFHHDGTSDVTIDLTNHREWLEHRRVLEASRR